MAHNFIFYGSFNSVAFSTDKEIIQLTNSSYNIIYYPKESYSKCSIRIIDTITITLKYNFLYINKNTSPLRIYLVTCKNARFKLNK